MSAVTQRKPDEKAPIDVIRAQVSALLPKHVTPERFMRAANLAVAQNPYLLTLDRMSLLQSVAKAAELGLTPGSALGECYLVPFKSQVQMIPGYRGLISLARRSGEIATIEAHVVYEGERFEHTIGDSASLRHEPNYDAPEQGKPRFPYARATFKDGGVQVEVVPRWRIEKIKADALAKTPNKARSPWTSHEMEMWRKTAVRALFKYLPVSTELIARALEVDDEATVERGEAAGEFVDFGAIQGERVEDVDVDATARLTATLAPPNDDIPA